MESPYGFRVVDAVVARPGTEVMSSNIKREWTLMPKLKPQRMLALIAMLVIPVVGCSPTMRRPNSLGFAGEHTFADNPPFTDKAPFADLPPIRRPFHALRAVIVCPVFYGLHF